MTGLIMENSHRGYFLHCEYYKKIQKNSSAITYETKPYGIFLAREITHVSKEVQEVFGVYQNEYQTMTIETPDAPELAVNDLILINGDRWIVLSVIELEITRRLQFMAKPEKRRQILVRK